LVARVMTFRAQIKERLLTLRTPLAAKSE